MSRTLYKQPSESRVYSMNFAADLESGETIVAVTSIVSKPPGLTVGSGTISDDGKKAQFRVADGDPDGESYKVTVVATTSNGNTLEGDGSLVVKEG